GRVRTRPAAGAQDAYEHVQLLTAGGRGAGAEGLVETPEVGEELAVDGEVGPGAEHAGAVGEQRRRVVVVAEAVHARVQPGRPGEPAVEVLLGGPVEGRGRDEAGHAAGAG